jgi:hypothetical protein
MTIALKRSVLEQAGEETVTALLEKLEKEKETVLSVRLDKGLLKALETQTRVWGTKNISSTVRAILSFYFLPVVYQLEWKDKQAVDFKKALHQQQELSSEKLRMNYFLKALFEYMNFLEQTKQASRETLQFAEKTEEELNTVIVEMQGKIQQALKELEQEQK